MKKSILICLDLLITFFCCGASEYPLVPMPKEIRITEKLLFAPEEIVILADQKALPAAVFNQTLKNHRIPGIAVRKTPGNASVVIRFQTGSPAPKYEQGYAVSVRKGSKQTSVLLAGHDKTGLLYAAVTFAQMFRNRKGKIEFPVTEIRDYPDVPGRYCASLNYAYRRRFVFRKDKDVSAAKRHIDWALEHKINIVSGELHHHSAQPENASPAVKRFFKEVNTYAAQRGITVFFVTHTNVGTKKRDGQKAEFRKCVELRGLLYDWSNDKLLERRAAEIARFVKDCGYTGLMLHTMDTANSLWGERNEATKKRFGDDRFSADAHVINIFYRAFRKVAPKGFFSAVPRPYFGNPENPVYIRKIGEMNSGDNYARFVKALPKDIYICKREESPAEHSAWMRTFRQNLFTYIEHNWGVIRFSGAPLGPNFRYIPGHFKKGRRDFLFYEANWPADYPAALAAVEFAWNLKTPGSRILNHPPYGSGLPYDRKSSIEEYDPFGPDGRRNPELLPLIRRVSDNLYAPYGRNFEVLLTGFIRGELVWDHRSTLEQLERVNLPVDLPGTASWLERIARDSRKALEALQQIPDDAPLFVRQTANSRIASLLSLAPGAAALAQGLKGEIALRKKDFAAAEKAADEMMKIYRNALQKLPEQWKSLRKKPVLFALPVTPGRALKNLGGELRLRELRIKSRIRMMKKRIRPSAAAVLPETKAGMINAAVYAPAAGSFFGARGLQSILRTLSDVKFTVIDDLKLETLLKFDCLVFPDCKKFGKAVPNIDTLRAYCERYGRGIYFEHDSCGHARFPFRAGIFPELGELDRQVGQQYRHRKYKASDRILVNKRTGEKFYGIYSDHFTFKGVAPGNVWAVDNTGSPAWVGGTVGKGRVVLNGGITFHLTNREVSAGEVSAEEKQLITDAISFCAGKKGHTITPEGLSSKLEVQTDAVRQVIRFKLKVEPAFPLKNGRLICRLRRDGKEIAQRQKKLPSEVAGSWKSDGVIRFDIIPGKKNAVLYITVTAGGKEATRSFKIPAPEN